MIGTTTAQRAKTTRSQKQTTAASKSAPKALYQPFPWQIPALRDKSKILLLTGSAGGGKSRTGLEKLNAYMLKYPGATGLMLRKAREYASKSIVPMMRAAVQQHDTRIVMRKSESHFEYPNGSVLYWGGMRDDGQREAIRSIGGDGGLDIILVEEANALTEDDFNELLARLRGTAAPWRQIILMTNPDAPTHWIYKRLIEGGEATVYYSSAKDNPSNPADYLETLNSLTGILAARLRDGKWAQAEGAVYDDFEPELHVVDWFSPPSAWKRIRAIDFGFVNPFVCQWWAIDPDGNMWLYREIYQSHMLVQDLAELINAHTTGVSLDEWRRLSTDDQRALSGGRLTAAWRDLDPDEQQQRLARVEQIAVTVADHDAEDRATLQRYGINTTPAKKDIKTGIETVQARLRRQGNGKPRLYVMRGATVDIDTRLDKLPQSTLEEFPAYVWQKPKEGTIAKEQPVDLHNHGMDAMRYGVMELDRPTTVQGIRNPFFR